LEIKMPTALELTREQWQPYIEAARHRVARPKMTLTEQNEREQLLNRVRQLALELKARFKVKRVILFGSLANTDWFSPDSDVDLAVEGLSSEAYWRAWRLAEEMIKSRSVDFVELETAKPSLRQAILRDGTEL
jgi:predicted nucleotidyltransferase